MKKDLVIVESPAKARTLAKYLGSNYVIEASVGHIKDLPAKKLGVNIEDNFNPEYEVIPGKKKVIDAIKKAARSSEKIYLAPDPDREGEAIAWHIAEELSGKKKEIFRAVFHEITKNAVLQAIQKPAQLDKFLFEAQQARRILDRLVGYKISPLLWSKVKNGLSAGRVQSVAVRIICEREEEIKAFQPQEYWSIDARVKAKTPPAFLMRLAEIDEQKIKITNEKQAQEVCNDLKDAVFTVSGIERKEVKRSPSPPFITSTLQQEAARRLRFSPKRTMALAQQLYEGIPLGEEGPTGLITYMRTDSTRISGEALNAVRSFIAGAFSPDYLPEGPRFFKNKKSAQDAHEAIRPTSLEWTPDRVAPYLEKPQLLLYQLIWNRFVASQMAEAIFNQTQVQSLVKKRYKFTATGMTSLFPGYLALYQEMKEEDKADSSPDEPAEAEKEDGALPPMKEGDTLTLQAILPEQNFTLPPPRFSESSLIKELEKKGIGRPSTYATIVSTIQDKEYVSKKKGRFYPTELGKIVTDILVQTFPEIMNVQFTAMMEDQLDHVEDGSVNWVDLLRNFYSQFEKRLSEAPTQMRNVRAEVKPTEILCEKCGAKMVIKWGKRGHFLACPNYPECRNTKEFEMDEEGRIVLVKKQLTEVKCEKCGRNMVVRNGKRGRFLACSGYPECRNTKPYPIGAQCPACNGEIVERMSQKGRVFYSCSNYPDCKFMLREMPLKKSCPVCNASFLIVEWRSGRKQARCPNDKCSYKEEIKDKS
ncbi:type I DNA topoisomerase [Candidatus Sumerlaeota bacterium]|nr:type I DNA topoisomerase [Candidatus Sumerlaeota bacterium]